jgi:hypothetical protein
MSEPRKSRIDPTIIAALIGVCGTVMVTLITLVLPRLTPATPTATTASTTASTQLDVPTWTAVPTLTNSPEPIPTDTVPAGDATSTSAPDTPTPEPTFTPAPAKIGEDWANGCISELWIAYPSIQTTENGDTGCLVEPIHYFFANDGRLTFLANGRFDDTQVYGMFAPLPANGTVSIDVFLRTLQDGEIWTGVFAEPDIASAGMIMVIPPGDVKNRLLVQKTMPDQVELRQTIPFAPSSPIYNVVFEFGSGSVTTRIMRDTVFDALPVGTTQQWLFVGFQVRRGNNRIDAEFLNLVIQP